MSSNRIQSSYVQRKGVIVMNILKLKAKCVEKNISRDELAFILGCSSSSIQRKLAGKSPITVDEAQRFSKAANLTDEEKFSIFLSE